MAVFADDDIVYESDVDLSPTGSTRVTVPLPGENTDSSLRLVFEDGTGVAVFDQVVRSRSSVGEG